ncbi:MAG: multidrug efflux RND transporter permease subunit [Verrucomicrobiota bacterium]
MKNLSFFFIDRPRFATVMSIFIVIIGAISYLRLPIAQFPEVAPPTVVVRAAYPGATPAVIADTVAAPIEQEVNGVEGMLYMSSQSTNDGAYELTISFELGTDLDTAQVLVQNRVAIAQPRLPDEVRQLGVTVQKSSPDLLLVVQMYSPDETFDLLYVTNYAVLQVREQLRRLDGVGDVRLFGGREYSMRVWLDPERLDFYELTSTEVIASLRQQNLQVAAGVIGQQPMESEVPFQINVTTLGRLSSPDEFERVVVKTSDEGRLVRVSDIARVELGAVDYGVNGYLNKTRTLAMPVFQRPGSNALDTAQAVRDEMDRLSADFPEGLVYEIVYDPTTFIAESIDAVIETLIEAVLLVMLVMLVFLQSWRAALIPILAIPISLIGTYAVMDLFGFSLNNLTLFGLVLAIGIVVDDAIVVVENIERNLAKGLKPREAARRSMAEVAGALVATTLVLLAVFIPSAAVGGITGQFYSQFALTIATSTVLSSIVSLTLSPALGVLLLRRKEDTNDWLTKGLNLVLGWFFNLFNKGFDKATNGYAAVVKRAVRASAIMAVLYIGFMAIAGAGFKFVPGGFIPEQDQGYCIVAAQLPPGASVQRSDEVARKIIDLVLETPGVTGVVGFSGFNGATFSNAPNAFTAFPVFDEFSNRVKNGQSGEKVINAIRQQLMTIDEGLTIVLPPPTVRGLGNGGGFKMMLQDRADLGYAQLEQATWGLIMTAMQEPEVVQPFTPFTAQAPQFYADIDREKAFMLGVPLSNVFDTLSVFLGSSYVNDVNLYGRTFRLTAQAEAEFRDTAEDVSRLKTRNVQGDMVPLGSVLSVDQRTGPDRVVRFNLYPTADLLGATAPGFSTGQALQKMEALAANILPQGMGYEWTELAYQEQKPRTSPALIFGLAVFFVFLLLAAQYESWSLPLAIILTVPLCLTGAIWGVFLRGMDNNILTQIGLIVLVGLASKNAILIVEFAKQLEDEGKDRFAAALEAARLRLRPILMTAFAFILGVLPLLLATGPGAEMRQALGTVVFYGMIAVTFCGIFFSPFFYVVMRGLFGKKSVEKGSA